jgi:exopolysaccharide production protein ExoZ
MTFCTLQLLRFVAAFSVLLFHLGLMQSGYKGVDIFFVISGYVMYLKLASPNRSGAFIFFVNRLTKIYFLYWLALALLYVIRPFPVDISLLKSIFLIYGHRLMLSVSWTLTHELYFYFLIGMVAYLLPDRFFNVVCLCLLLATTLVTTFRLSSLFYIPRTTFLLGKTTWEFFLGVAAAYLSARFFTACRIQVLLFMTLLSLVLLFVIRVPLDTISLSAAIYGLLSFSLVFCMTAYERRVSIPGKIAIAFKILGDASYAIYLLGPLVAILVPGNNALSKTTIIIATILVSVFINRVVEVNGLRWFRKMMYRLR